MSDFELAAPRNTTRSTFVDRELTLSEMLADPIVQMVMRRDRVRPETVIALFARRPDRHAA